MTFRSCDHAGGKYHGVGFPCSICGYTAPQEKPKPAVVREITIKIRVLDSRDKFRVETQDTGTVKIDGRDVEITEITEAIDYFFSSWLWHEKGFWNVERW